MEIIKQGNLSKIEVTCPRCGMIGRIVVPKWMSMINWYIMAD